MKSPQLIAAFESVGCEAVSTFLASGNVIFDLPGGRPGPVSTVVSDIEAALLDALGYPVPTTVRDRSQLGALADDTTFAPALAADPERKPQVMLTIRTPLDQLQTPADQMQVPAGQMRETTDSTASRALPVPPECSDILAWHGRDVLWLPPKGISDSKLNLQQIEAEIGPFTVRTMNTVRRLVPKLGPFNRPSTR